MQKIIQMAKERKRQHFKQTSDGVNVFSLSLSIFALIFSKAKNTIENQHANYFEFDIVCCVCVCVARWKSKKDAKKRKENILVVLFECSGRLFRRFILFKLFVLLTAY